MACLRNIEKVVFQSTLGDLDHSHTKNLKGLYYLAWLESWCHYFGATLFVLKACVFVLIIASVHPFSLSANFPSPRLPSVV